MVSTVNSGTDTYRTLKAASGSNQGTHSGAPVPSGVTGATARAAHSGEKVDCRRDKEVARPRRGDSGGWNRNSSPEPKCHRRTACNATTARNMDMCQRIASIHSANGASRQNRQKTASRRVGGGTQCFRNRDSLRGLGAPGYKYRPSRGELRKRGIRSSSGAAQWQRSARAAV